MAEKAEKSKVEEPTRQVAQDPAESKHLPVLFAEVKELLPVAPGALVVDGTLGGGGHTRLFLEQGAQVLGLDADPAAIRRVSATFAAEIAAGRLIPVHSPFEDVGEVARAHGFTQIDAFLVDLGTSSFQLETPERGFSFLLDGELDMRFDPTQGISAGEIVNQWDAEEIANLLYEYGEEGRSRSIARAIVRSRPITSTTQLAQVIERATGGRRGARIHPATQSFQALRIAVNRELEQLQETLPQALELLKAGGRMGVIAFHSLEDRIVKQWLVQEASDFTPNPHHPFGGVDRQPTVRLITRKPVMASTAEIDNNPRSRSARLRVGEKI